MPCTRWRTPTLSRIFYERYTDRAALDTHEAQPHTRHFLTEKDALLSGSRVEFLTPTSAAR
jgi:quinol monooxygenase YgiN